MGVGAEGKQPVVITRSAAWMADWACYVDEPSYHDPEVAVADGYGAIPLPPGALTLVGLAPAALGTLPEDASLHRSWAAARPVLVGENLQLGISVGEGIVTGRFISPAGEEVVVEEFAVDAAESLQSGGAAVFRTGPIDCTRRRALLSGVAQFRPGGAWLWGTAPKAATELCWRLVAPAVVAARAALPGPDAPRRVRAIHVTARQATVTEEPFVAETIGESGGWKELAIRAGGTVIARAKVELSASVQGLSAKGA